MLLCWSNLKEFCIGTEPFMSCHNWNLDKDLCFQLSIRDEQKHFLLPSISVDNIYYNVITLQLMLIFYRSTAESNTQSRRRSRSRSRDRSRRSRSRDRRRYSMLSLYQLWYCIASKFSWQSRACRYFEDRLIWEPRMVVNCIQFLNLHFVGQKELDLEIKLECTLGMHHKKYILFIYELSIFVFFLNFPSVTYGFNFIQVKLLF